MASATARITRCFGSTAFTRTRSGNTPRLSPGTGRRSMRSTRPRWPLAAPTTARPACAITTGPITTPPSCSTRTATTWKRSIAAPDLFLDVELQFEDWRAVADPAGGDQLRAGPLSLRVFGCLPVTARGAARRQASEKPRRRKPRGEYAPAAVSVYGDLRR